MQSTRILWTDADGYPITFFKDMTSFVKYRSISEKHFQLDSWNYIDQGTWMEKFGDSPGHMRLYDEVKWDHIDHPHVMRIVLFGDDGSIIKKFYGFHEAQDWLEEHAGIFFYWRRLNQYMDTHTFVPHPEGKLRKGPSSRKYKVWEGWKPRYYPSDIGPIFMSTYEQIFPSLGHGTYFSDSSNKAWFYFPCNIYETRKDMLMTTKVLVN